MAFFNTESTYNVWERKGISRNKKGILSISERTADEGEILPDQELKYLGKKVEGFEGLHALQLEDGRVVAGHRNHFDVSTPYNQSKLASRQAKAEREAAKAIEAAEQAQAEAEAQSEEAPAEMTEEELLEQAAVQLVDEDVEAA